MPILGAFIYFFLNMSFNSWVTAIFIKQVSYLLNLFFNIETNIFISSDKIVLSFPNSSFSGRVFPVCYGAQMISIFIGIILVTPSSNEPTANKNFIWRKVKIITITILSTYLLYLLRMWLMLAFIYNGVQSPIIHDSTYYLITLISFIIILYSFRKILPEFIIALHYIYYLISNKGITNNIFKKTKIQKKPNLIRDLTIERKEAYYPLLGITICTAILFAIGIFLNIYGIKLFYITINLYEMVLPLILAMIILITRYLFDMVNKLKIFISILTFYLGSDVLNGITIAIYFTSVFFIYYFFHKEVKIYLLIERL